MKKSVIFIIIFFGFNGFIFAQCNCDCECCLNKAGLKEVLQILQTMTQSNEPKPDKTQPKVTSLTPHCDAINVPADTTISVRFSEAMDPSTLENMMIVKDNEGMSIEGTISYTGLTAIFKPDQDFNHQTTYTITISTHPTDLAGNHLNNEMICSFITTSTSSSQSDKFSIELSQQSPPWGAIVLSIKNIENSALNIRNAIVLIESPIDITSMWGDSAGSTSSINFVLSSKTENNKYLVNVKLDLPEAEWVDSMLEPNATLSIKFSPSSIISLSDIKILSINLQSGGNSGKHEESSISLPNPHDSLDLRVSGWGNCLVMGTVTSNSPSINASLARSEVRSIFKYAGNGGNGDRGQILKALVTQSTIEQARAIENEYKKVMPVMVVYTAEASGGGAAEPDILNETIGGETCDDCLYKHYINLIRIVRKIQSYKDNDHPNPGSIILNPDLLGAWQQNKNMFEKAYKNTDGTYKTIPVRDALTRAVQYVVSNDGASTVSSLPSEISDDVLGFMQSQNFVIRYFGPDVTFGWQQNLWSIGSSLWVHKRYSGNKEFWDKVSSKVVLFMNELKVYSGNWKPDFLTFDKYERDGLGSQARSIGYAFNSEDWKNYLLYVKQLTDYYKVPALLWQIPGGHMPTKNEVIVNYEINAHTATGGPFFLGDKAIGDDLTNIKDEVLNLAFGSPAIYDGATTVGEYLREFENFDWGKSRLRETTNHNVFAILWGGGSTTSVVNIGSSGDDDGWLANKVKNYYANGCIQIHHGESTETGNAKPITNISNNPLLDQVILSNESEYNSKLMLTEQPDNTYAPSTIYRWKDFIIALKRMHVTGVGSYKFWLGGSTGEDVVKAKYGLVNIAAFIAQCMKETIKYDACDENNWTDPGVTNNYPEELVGKVVYPMTSACGQLGQNYSGKGYGEGDPMACPDNPEKEIFAMTHAKWYGAPAPLFAVPDSVLEYEGLLVNGKTGRWDYASHCNGAPATQPNFELEEELPPYLRPECEVYNGQKAGKFVWDGSSGSLEGCIWWGRGVIQTTGRGNYGKLNHYLGRTHLDMSDPEINTNYPRPQNILYPDIDFCSNPDIICSSKKYPELKWIAGLFYWMSSVQTYEREGWNYMTALKKYVDNGFIDDSFIDSVSGIVNRGCHNPPCGTGELDGGPERKNNFLKILQVMGIIK